MSSEDEDAGFFGLPGEDTADGVFVEGDGSPEVREGMSGVQGPGQPHNGTLARREEVR